ncbi:MAG: hypothetical protein QI197_07155 [Candidatus Korarchaeota archaeon]|nr:hypothetical protein [Candidatus Korarchaeota archaeon]
MRFTKLLPLLLLILGAFLLVYGLIPRENLVGDLVLENGTYEIVKCQGTMILQANGSLCMDLRDMRLREISRGSSVNELVSFPLLEVRGSRLELAVSNYDAVWRRSYDFSDGGSLIPVEMGEWNLSASSDGQITLYEIESYNEVRGELIKSDGSIRVTCGSISDRTYLVLYNPSQEPLRVRVLTDHDIDIYSLSISIGLVLAALLMRRYSHAIGSGRGAFTGAGLYPHS